jgi:putative membrane-bound dehydrogenase-like protein
MSMKHLASFAVLVALTSSLHALPPTEKPLSPREAAAAMTVPPGFRVTLFAGEPDVVQPIAFTFDDRGRLWVCENFSYPGWVKDGKAGKDRIVIFEDTKNVGTFDKKTVFADNLANLTGIEWGFGGIFATCAPNLLFIPVKDDKPAGPPQVLLDGFSLEVRHNMINSLKWGPDGWLYGLHGIVATSWVGTPGTPKDKRPPINCGVWRYHPTKKRYEPYAYGTTNPWGIDWDETGEMFITNCVIDHAFHIVQGGRYQRMYGQDLNPYAYQLMKSPCDHIHWAGGAWQSSREAKGKHSDAGGGHAHVGCMIYQGDNFPPAYRNTLFTLNLHGNRVNNDILERTDAGYAIRHGKDFLFANDPWFRGLAINYGPDGGVYITDWTDTGECHNYNVAHQTTGRIYKVTYGTPRHEPKDLAKLSDEELVKLLFHDNEWYARRARRLLQERTQERPLAPELLATLRTPKSPELRHRLRCLWALNAVGDVKGMSANDFVRSLEDTERLWAIRLLLEHGKFNRGEAFAFAGNLSNFQRLHLASLLQRIPIEDRIIPAYLLCKTPLEDTNTALMIWYAVEGLVEHSLKDSVTLLYECRVPLVRENLTRRLIASQKTPVEQVGLLLTLLKERAEPAFQRDVLRGARAALIGARSFPGLEAWRKIYPALAASPLQEVRDGAIEFAILFGDEAAFETLHAVARNKSLAEGQRQSALRLLVQHRVSDLKSLLDDLLAEEAMRATAIRGFASIKDDSIPQTLLKLYPSLPEEEQADVVQTLSSRPSFALALLDAVGRKLVPRDAISSFTARQIHALGDKQVSARLEDVWGAIRPASKDKEMLLAKFKKQLNQASLKKANLANGRALYQKNCMQCHKLFDEGGDVGPELTGSQRANLDYVLENVLDPSAVVQREYQVVVVTLDSGRTLTGIVKEETDRALTLRTQNELVVISKAEIESRVQSKLSMMPDGMFDKLTNEEVRDLVAYLASPVQVAPAPARK